MAVGVEIATAYVSIVPSFRGIKQALAKGIAGGATAGASQMEKPLTDGAKKAAKKAASAATKEFDRELRPWVTSLGGAVSGAFKNISAGFTGLNIAQKLGIGVAKNQLEDFGITTTKTQGRIQTAFSNMGTSIKNAFKSFETSSAVTDTWGQRLFASLGKMDDKVVSVFSSIGTKINTGLGNAFGNVSKKMAEAIGVSDNMASKFSKLSTGAVSGFATMTGGLVAMTAAAGVAAVAAAGVGLAIAGINRLSTLQQSTIAFEVMLGSAEKAKEVMGELTKFAKTTPFPLADISEAAKTLKAMGQDTEKLVPTLKAAGDAAAALGTGTQGMKDISFIMGQIITKGKLEGDELVQLAERGVNASAILGNKLGVKATEAGAKIKDMGISAKEAVAMIVDGIENGTEGVNGATAKMGGMLEKFKNTWEGRWTDMKASFSRLGAVIFEPLFAGGQSVMSRVTVLMDRAGEAWQRLMKAWKDTGVQAAFDHLGTSIGNVMKALVPAKGDFQSLSEKILPALRMSINFIADKLQQLANFLKENQWVAKSLAMALTVIGILFIVVAAAAVVFLGIMYATSAAVVTLAGAIIDSLYHAFKWVIDVAPGFFQGLWDYLKMSFWDFIDIVVSTLQFLWDFFVMVCDILGAVWFTVWEFCKSVVLSFWYFITGQWSRIGDAWSNFGNQMTSIWSGVWGSIKGMAASAVNFIVSIINGAIGQVNSLIGLINRIPGVSIPKIPDVPRLASGGIATSATTAIIGEGSEPEAVMPLSKLQDFINVNQTQSKDTQVVISAAGADRQFLTFIRSLVRTNGGGDVQKAFGI